MVSKLLVQFHRARRNFRLLRTMVLLVAITVIAPTSVFAQWGPAVLHWDPSPDPNVAGYIIQYGTASRAYHQSVDVGENTQWQIPNLPDGSYYFAVLAYDDEGVRSSFSNEVVHRIGSVIPAPRNLSELIWRHTTTGHIASWQMAGLQLSGGNALGPGAIDLSWQIVGAGDFNRDGHRDLVWRHNDGRTSLWLMQGTQLMSGTLFTPDRVADTNWRIVAVADMNLDLYPDLVWQHMISGDMSVWFMNGLRQIGGTSLNPGRVPAAWRIVGAGDFNGDMWPDLLFRHQTDGSLAVWFMRGTQQLAGRSLQPAAITDLNWKVVAVGDMNGDRRADIFWQHTDGRLGAWVMDGTDVLMAQPLNPGVVADLGWRVSTGR